MASLHEVIGSFKTQIDRGRCQADLATLEIASIYKDHPLLSSFPIPKMTIDQVDLDLKLSIGSLSEPANYMNPQLKKEVTNQISQLIAKIPNSENSLRDLISKSSNFKHYWESDQTQIEEKISNLLPSEGAIDIDRLSISMATVIRSHIVDELLDPQKKIPVNDVLKYNKSQALTLEAGLKQKISEIITDVVKPSIIPDRMEVFITASDLQNIPLEKISTMRITFKQSDQVWTQIQKDQGESYYKIVPE